MSVGGLFVCIQWNPSIAAILGEQNFGRYIRGGLYWWVVQTVHLGPGFLPVIRRWPLFRGVAVKRCSTVYTFIANVKFFRALLQLVC